jgi:hypothetical protein
VFGMPQKLGAAEHRPNNKSAELFYHVFHKVVYETDEKAQALQFQKDLHTCA